MKSLTDIEQELLNISKQTERERQAAVAKHKEQLATIEAETQHALAEQAAKMKSDKEKWDKAAAAAQLAEGMKKKEETESRIRLEQVQNIKDEELRAIKEVADRLAKEVEQKEFFEEQYRKAIEVVLPLDLTLKGRIELRKKLNIEHPAAPEGTEPGGAADGTTGATPDSPVMSAHLRMILRQANRED